MAFTARYYDGVRSILVRSSTQADADRVLAQYLKETR